MKLALKGGQPVREKPFPAWPYWDAAERDSLLRILESGKWGSIDGDEVRQFEEEFADFQGAAFGIANTNGTTSLEVALRAAGIEAGDEVILPAYTFVASATAVLNNAAVPVFADIDPHTYNLDPAGIEAHITGRTRAIMPVHFAGRPAEMDRILAIAAKHDLAVVEDAAQGWGAQWQGMGVGTLGDAGTFSFQSSKNMTAGEGGIVLTNKAEVAELARSVVNCGRMEKGLWYAHYRLGGNLRMTAFQAALLRVHLARYPAQQGTRIRSMNYLDRELAKIPGIHPMHADERITRHACHLYILRFESGAFDGVTKSSFIDALRAEGIPCSPGYSLPLYEQPLFQNRAFAPFTKIIGDRVDYRAVRLEHTEKACREQAVWFTQNILLDGPEGMQSIVDAIAKVHEHRHELHA